VREQLATLPAGIRSSFETKVFISVRHTASE
jgi:hypothetical protein